MVNRFRWSAAVLGVVVALAGCRRTRAPGEPGGPASGARTPTGEEATKSFPDTDDRDRPYFDRIPYDTAGATSPEELARILFNAVKSGDREGVRALCVSRKDVEALLIAGEHRRIQRKIAGLLRTADESFQAAQDLEWGRFHRGREKAMPRGTKGFLEETPVVIESYIHVLRSGKPDQLRVRGMIRVQGRWKIAEL